MRITDISEAIGPAGAPPTGRRAPLVRYLGSIVAAATAGEPGGGPVITAIRCRRRPGRRRCSGRVSVRWDGGQAPIHWRCDGCGDEGVIDGWRGTPWDLSPAADPDGVVSLCRERRRRETRAAMREPVRPFRLRVELVAGPTDIAGPVSRVLTIGGDASLQRLHHLLCEAFDRPEDATYEFMIGAPYERDARRFVGSMAPWFDEPGALSGAPSEVTVEGLGISLGRDFGYLYDFDDPWVHRLSVLEVGPPAGDRVRAAVISREGASPGLPDTGGADGIWADDVVDDTIEYCASERHGGVAPDLWLAMDDIDRLVLVVDYHESHAAAQPDPGHAGAFHAVVHCLAETRLAEGCAEARAFLERAVRARGERHAAVHALGERLARQLLDPAGGPRRRKDARHPTRGARR